MQAFDKPCSRPAVHFAVLRLYTRAEIFPATPVLRTVYAFKLSCTPVNQVIWPAATLRRLVAA